MNDDFQEFGIKPFFYRTGDQIVDVYPYSIFYVYYEQYLTMWDETLFALGISLLAIFLVTFVLMGLDLVSSIIAILVIFMILVDLMGMRPIQTLLPEKYDIRSELLKSARKLCFTTSFLMTG